MNTEPQTSYCVLNDNFFWLKSQMQAVTVRAEPRRAGTLTTRYSSLLLTALDGKLFKSHLAHTQPKVRCASHSTQAGDAAPLAPLPLSSSASCHPRRLWGAPPPWLCLIQWPYMEWTSWKSRRRNDTGLVLVE